MKKVLFVDERKYRFAFYYENEGWWKSNGVSPRFKAYEKKRDKWLIYLSLLFNRPSAVIFVQLSTKNIILSRLCNTLGIKTIFWQHGVFKYDDATIAKMRKMNASLDCLLGFSRFDIEQIGRHFKKVAYSEVIPHYETAKVKHGIRVENSVLYIGQILSWEQIEKSSGRMEYHEEGCETALNELWDFLSKSDMKVYLRKHPGDKSNYLESLAAKHPNFELSNEFIVPDFIAGHYSTLIIPYIQAGIPFIQIHHEYNSYIDFRNYSDNEIYPFDIPTIHAIAEKRIGNASGENTAGFKSISQYLLEKIV